MSQERERKGALPEGWRRFKIVACQEGISKAGNEQFIMTFRDCETQQDEPVYAIAVQGKRWFLKSILSACGIEAAKDGVYDWDIIDILDQYVLGRVEHVQEDPWIDREGKTRPGATKGKIVEIKQDDGSGAPDIPKEEMPF
jgi:hypothetical protein